MQQTTAPAAPSPMPAAYVGTHMEEPFRRYVADLARLAKRAETRFLEVDATIDHRVIDTGGPDYALFREHRRRFALTMVHLDMHRTLRDLIPLLGPAWDRLHRDVENLRTAYEGITAALTTDLPNDAGYQLRTTFCIFCNLLLDKYDAAPVPVLMTAPKQ